MTARMDGWAVWGTAFNDNLKKTSLRANTYFIQLWSGKGLSLVCDITVGGFHSAWNSVGRESVRWKAGEYYMVRKTRLFLSFKMN